MARKKLTSDERLQRKRAAWEKLSGGGKRYTEGPRGSRAQWASAASLILNQSSRGDLAILGLRELPQTVDILKKAWKKAMLRSHPDRGGTAAEAMDINASYERLQLKFIQPIQAKDFIKVKIVMD